MGNYHHSIAFCSINYLHVLMDNYVAFFMKFHTPYWCNIQNTDKRYIFSYFRPCARFFFYHTKIDSTNKKLVKEIVVLVFHWCLRNKHKITCPLVDANFNLLEFHSMSTGTLQDKIRIHSRACNILYILNDITKRLL